MSKKFLLWLLVLCFYNLPQEKAYCDVAPFETIEGKRIAQIDISMENPPPDISFDPKTVQGRMRTKSGDPFSQTTFDQDLKSLIEDYDRVEPRVEIINGEVYITIKVWPRPKIRKIDWEGNQHIKAKSLQSELDIKAGSTFNRQAFNKAFNKVKEYYLKKGYFESQLYYTISPDAKTNEVDIKIFVEEGRSGYIEKISFEGFTKEEESELLAMVHTKKYNFFISWFSGSGIFNEEAIDQDKLTIINFLQNEGYADANVDFNIIDGDSKGKVAIVIVANKGQLYHFGTISFEGNQLFQDSEIESRFLARPEGVYSPEKIRDTVQSIKDLYGRKGYIDATVQYETHLEEDAPMYDVHFRIDEGQEYKIGLIYIFGNTSTQSNVILRECHLVPGETFDSTKLKSTQQKLENMGYFKSVNVYSVRTREDDLLGDNYRDVFIEVEENHTGNISLFGGFSSSDSIFGGLDLTETNFNITGMGHIFSDGLRAIRGGGEYAHIRFSAGSKVRSISFSWLDPYVRDSKWRLGFEISTNFSELQSRDYDIKTANGSVYTSYPINSFWAAGLKYRVRYTDSEREHDLSRQEARELGGHGYLSGMGGSIVFDSTDSPIKPHRGLRSVFESDFTGLGGNYTFFRFSYINAQYNELWKHGILKFRYEGRFIEPVWKTNVFDKIPVSERFFLGGENSVRGYKPFDLGPRFQDGAPKGGISSLLFSVEYLHELIPLIDLFAFFDAGSVSSRRFSMGKINMSAGVGTRLMLSSQSPFVFGIGFPINPDHKSQVERFFFSMGGQF